MLEICITGLESEKAKQLIKTLDNVSYATLTHSYVDLLTDTWDLSIQPHSDFNIEYSSFIQEMKAIKIRLYARPCFIGTTISLKPNDFDTIKVI